MPATLQWQQSTAASATWSGSDSFIRFKAANNNTDDLNNPLVRPSAGTNYSWEKALRIYVASGTFTQLSSLRVKLSTADIGTGLGGNVAQAYDFKSAYTQPIGTGPMAGREGALGTSEVAWNNAVNHAIGDGVAVQWNGSDLLYCQLEIGTGSGGELTSWNTIAVYNEI